MKQLQIFLVEDDDILAKTTEWRIRKLGYGFSGRAGEGRDAAGRIAHLNPDIVLIDLSLRGEVGGVETAELIRQQQDLPIIFLFTHADRETIARAKKTSPKGYLVKPFDDQDLMAAIEMAAR